ncbi:hypothetical protein [Glycomyces albidus]|uniref:Uncharacterized protein n=1 Tax=Glycomyces albidus TaxID=2656774 RepID=A0A6L5GFM7_9ACTN|nr:hypothetical protein [Glycomyces albidus]MQM28381.1 hypothetical protein [Glycomyces albidus]
MSDEPVSDKAMPGKALPSEAMPGESMSGESMSGSDTRPSPRDGDKELFRAHATARLRGDTETALGLAVQIGEARRMAHLLFVLYLFCQVVVEEFGTRPDPEDLAALTKRLHEKHYRPGNGFCAIRAEALVRAVCGESLLMTEVPVSEQPGYMWAVMTELVDPGVTDGALMELFAGAEVIGAEVLSDTGRAMFGEPFGPPAPRTEAAPGPGSERDPVPAEARPADIRPAAAADEEETE